MLILQSFWTYNTDIWASLISLLGIGLSALGIYYSIKAFHEAELAKKEAELAKNAAYSAGVVVKTQEILMELQQILHECHFNEGIVYFEANNKLNIINSRVYTILGIYEKDEDEQMKKVIEIIKTNSEAIKSALENANPSAPASIVNNKKIDEKIKIHYIYNITAPHFTKLINNLSTLKGILNSKLIKNQTNGN